MTADLPPESLFGAARSLDPVAVIRNVVRGIGRPSVVLPAVVVLEPRLHMRLRLLAVIALAVPLTSCARPQTRVVESRAPNAVAQTFRAFGRPYGAWLVMAFDSIPASQYGFRPTPAQQSIGYIAQHLEDANYQLCSLFGETKYVRSARDSLADTIKAQWPKDSLVARVRASLVFCGAAIEKLTDADLADELTANTRDGPQTVRRVRYLILLVTDLAEHYAQLSSYMRILGMTPPSALPPSG